MCICLSLNQNDEHLLSLNQNDERFSYKHISQIKPKPQMKNFSQGSLPNTQIGQKLRPHRQTVSKRREETVEGNKSANSGEEDGHFLAINYFKFDSKPVLYKPKVL